MAKRLETVETREETKRTIGPVRSADILAFRCS
jgi:hypothetical protein